MKFTIKIKGEDLAKRSGLHEAANRRKAGKMRHRNDRRNKDAGKIRRTLYSDA